DDRRHEAPAPVGLGQPVTDFSPVGFADLQTVEAAAADQALVRPTNRPADGLALLPGHFRSERQPGIGSGLGIGEWNAEGALVNVPVVEGLDEGVLVGRAKFAQVNLVCGLNAHDDFPTFTCFSRKRSRTQQPRTCSSPDRQWLRMSGLSQPASSRASARTGTSAKRRS